MKANYATDTPMITLQTSRNNHPLPHSKIVVISWSRFVKIIHNHCNLRLMLNKQKIYVDKLQGSNEQFFRVYQQTYTCVKLKIKTTTISANIYLFQVNKKNTK